jgi:anti-anti-sigma regulatory factor
VRLLSAAGLTELVNLRDRLTRADARLALAAASQLVRRVVTITGLDGTMTLADTVDDAVHLLNNPACQSGGSTGHSCRDSLAWGTPPQ